MSSVYIVLATYQGDAFLQPLLESIQQQSWRDWTLLVRDDGSMDGTRALLNKAAQEDPRICLVNDNPVRMGAIGNFGILLERAHRQGAEYLFCADQDDVWRPEKLARQMELLCEREMCQGRRQPQLVYSDLAVVDEALRPLHPSFLRCSGLRHGPTQPLATLLGRSFVLGCAMGVNRPLMDFALPMPAMIASHDWWLALCAAAAGDIAATPEPLLWYRRHTANASGSASFWAGFDPRRHSWRKRWTVGRTVFRQSVQQAVALRERLRERCPTGAEQSLPLLDAFCEAQAAGLPGARRVIELLRLGLPAIDLPRRLLYYLCVCLEKEGRKPTVD